MRGAGGPGAAHSLRPLTLLAQLAAERPTVRRLASNKLLLVHFVLIGEIRDVETIASGHGIRVYSRLVREFGKATSGR